MNIPPKYEDVVAKLGAERELHKLATETLGQFADENQKLHANLAALREELDQCGSMAAMVESKEWAEHAGTGPASSRVESAFTQLHNDLAEVQQRLTVAERRVGELDQLVADQPSLYFEGCNFMGFNSDGSSPLEFSEGPIRKLISVRMIGWRCEGPRVAVNLSVMSCPPMESGLPITAYCAALKPTEEGEGS